MEPFISQGFLRFREDFDTAPENYTALLEQLQNFPQGKIDGPDALQCAHSYTQTGFSCRTVIKDDLPFEQQTDYTSDQGLIQKPNPALKSFDFLESIGV